jgi:NAD(P)-dependent dehydrogenase (short-subunit alcohol dehydrogenase family)
MTQPPFSVALAGKAVIVVGGSSGIGRAVAAASLRLGARATIIGRDAQKLVAAQSLLAPYGVAEAARFDMTDAKAVADYFGPMAPNSVDHLVISASSAVHGAFATTPADDVRRMFESKFFGPYTVAQACLPKMADGGSITLFSGVLSRRPGMNCSGLGAVNAAVEGLARAMALEIGPKLRVNCCSPGMVVTEAYANMPDDRRAAMYQSTGASLPVGRVGTADEIADATLMLMTNGYMTGQVLDIDGGHMVRQYA